MCQSISLRAAFEKLESRRLLSTVNVTNFGAVPNDSGDDSAAIQRAINSSGHRDTIYFPDGTYNIGTSLTTSATASTSPTVQR
jgi:polygalacturonase